MVVLPELNDDQRLFLKSIFDYFHVEGKWPTYLSVENTILRTHPEKRSEFDLAEICKSLPDGFASGFGFNRNYEQEAGFIAPVLYYFPEAKEEMADFIRVVCFCVEKINASDEVSPEISSEDLSSQLHMQPLAIRKMYFLLQWEPSIMAGSAANEEWWRMNLQRGRDGVRRFEGIETFEQYLTKRTALTRMFSGQTARRPVPIEPANKHLVFTKEVVMDKVKVLFLAANPLGTDRLKLDEEIRAIIEKVYASEYREYLQVESAWAIRPDDLLQSLNRHRPHIVHFSGHGSQAGELILVDNTGSPKAINTMALKALFTALKDNIQVVILNACYSRSQATAITEVINCVVGMNDAIGDEAAIIFAASFYRALGFGRSVQEAFDQGRVALLLEGIPEENTPELLVKEGIDPSQIILVSKTNTSLGSSLSSFELSSKKMKRERLFNAYKVILNAADKYQFEAQQLSHMPNATNIVVDGVDEAVNEISLDDDTDVLPIFFALRGAFNDFSIKFSAHIGTGEEILKHQKTVLEKFEELKTVMKKHLKELES